MYNNSYIFVKLKGFCLLMFSNNQHNNMAFSKDHSRNSDNIISMRGVGIRYDQNPEILSDVNLDIQKGSFHFLNHGHIPLL